MVTLRHEEQPINIPHGLWNRV